MTHKLLEIEAFAGADSWGGAACRTGASAIWIICVGGPNASAQRRGPMTGCGVRRHYRKSKDGG
jgi:hypothetical protein